VLDEPNSNLDAAGETALAETLRRAKAKKVTVVVITQRPSVLNNVDKLLILKAGRIEAIGPAREVLHRLVRPATRPTVGGAMPTSGEPVPPAPGSGERAVT
jgi:ATP-binding cassette subfamily C protein